jgi:putative membrane protein
MMGAIICFTGLTSCDNKPDDAKEAAEEVNEEVKDTRKGEKDAQFLVDAADINLMEVHMAQQATKATLQEVKDYAKKMETDHQKAYDDVAALAASKNITIPGTVSEEGMKHHMDINEKTGYDFDRAFMDKMVDGHETAVKKFEEAADDCEDVEIKAWAAKMVPELQAHLDQAKLIKEKVKDMK